MIALTNIERPTETETRGYSGNQQVEVSETNFYNIDGGGVAGGAISCNSSNSLSTLDCSIANTSTISSGGSLHIYYASSMNIQRLNCVNGSAAQAGGHIHIALTTGSGIVKECHLENGTCGTNFGGGGIWVRDLSVGNPLTFSLIEFVNCCSKCGNITMGGGGGMFVAHNSLEEEYHLEDTLYSHHNLFLFSFVSFLNCTSKGTNTGHDIYVGNEWKSYVREEMIKTCLSTKERGISSVYVEGEGNKDSWLPSSFSSLFLSSSDGIDFISCGISIENPCKTMKNIKNLFSLFSFPPLFHIHIISPLIFDHEEEVGGKSFVSSDEKNKVELIAPEEVEGEGEEWVKNSLSAEFTRITFSYPYFFSPSRNFLLSSSPLEFSDSLSLLSCCFSLSSPPSSTIQFSLLSISCGSLFIENCSNSPSSFSSTLSSSLLSLSSGIASFTSSSFSSFLLSSVPLLSINGGKINLNGTKIEKITRGSGGGIIGTTGAGGEIEMKGDSEIEECKAAEGNGGGMMIILNGNEKVTLDRVKIKKNEVNQLNGMGGGIYLSVVGDTPDWSFSSVLFEGNKGWKGKHFMFRCFNLRTNIIESKWDFADSYFGTSDNIMGIDSTIFSSPISLLYFVVGYSSNIIHLGKGEEEGRDGEEKWCGMALYPCSSLSVGLSHLEGEYERTGYVMNQLNIDGCVELNNVLFKIRCPSSSSSSFCFSSSFPSSLLSSVFYCVGPSLFENLDFLLPSSISPSSPPLSSLLSSSLSLILTNISILPLSPSSSSSLPFCLFSFLSGTIKIEGMEMKDIVCSHWLMKIEREIQLNVSNVEINGIESEEGIMKVNGNENQMKIMNVSIEDFNSSLSFFMMNDINSIDCNIEKLSASNCKSKEGSFFSLHPSSLDSSLSNLPSSLSFSLSYSSFSSLSSDSPIFSSSFPSFHLKDVNFSSCFSLLSHGSILSVSSSSSLSLIYCSIEGVMNADDDDERKTEGDEVCDWNGSIVNVEESEGRMELLTIMNSSKGGMKIKGGEIKITQGQFEENNPRFNKCPSFRRNVICEGGGKIEIESLKGGDGQEKESSLWTHPKTDCEFIDGITTERKSLFFIPSLNKVEKKKEEGDSEYLYSFSGSLFIPCSLSLSLVFVNEIGDGLEEMKNVEWKSESEGVGIVEKNLIDQRPNEEEVLLCLIFDGEGSLGKQTERHLIRNKIEKKKEDDDNDDDGPSTQSTNLNEGGNAPLIILVVFLSLLLIGAGIAIVFFVLRYRRKIRILEEDAMKKSEVTTKENGIEMLEKKEDVNNSCSDSSFDCSSFKKDDENCTSSSALLPDRTETITYSHTGPSEEDAKKEKEEKEKKQKEEEEKQRLEEQEEEQRKERERLNVSTESLHYLTSGLASLEPFNVEYCDIRDSIFHHYIHNEGKKPNFERRRNVAVKIYFELGGVCMYVMTIGEEGEDYLSGLSPFSIVISSSSTSSFILVRESEVVGSRVYGGGIDAFRMKMSRWKSPERLNGQITKENEKSIVYTLSMIVFTIMDLTIPFEDILSDELTVGKVTMGERPSLDHLINCHCDLVDLIVNSWSGIPYERMGLYDLRMKAAEMNCEGGTQNDEDYE